MLCLTNILLTVQITCVALMFVYIVYIVTTKKAGAYSVLTAALASAFLNCFAYTMLLFADGLQSALAVKPFDIMGSALAMYLLYWFARESQGINIPKAVSILLLAADLFGIVSSATDRAFHLYFRSIEPVTRNGDIHSANVVYNVGFYVLMASMLVKTGLITAAAVFGCVKKSSANGQTKSSLPLFTVLLPFFSMVLYSFRIFGDFNPSSLVMCASCVTITAFAYHGGNYEMVKTARDSIIESMDDALIVTDSKLNIVDSMYDTADMLNDVISITYVQLDKKKDLDFRIDMDRRIPRKMYGDEVRLKQILINLLGNAVKFTSSGWISLSVKELSRMGDSVSLMFKVADSGMGIKKEDIPKLFENFQQVDTRKNRRIEGSGLGLPISKTLAEKMDGSITVESEYGKGSVFTVVLIQKIADPAPMPKTAARTSSANEKKRTLRAPGAHVLVVDDNRVNLNVTAQLLNSYGIKAELADSGAKAIEMINSAYYDLVFMDHMMPELDGVDTTKIIRSAGDAYSLGLPIIALTANAINGAKEMFLESGFNDFISKPIQLPLLEKILETWLPPQMITYSDAGEKSARGSMDDDSDIFRMDAEAADTADVSAADEDDIVIPNVDVMEGLKLCGGNVNAYLAILKTFRETAEESILRIETCAQNRDYKNYTTEVHGLKSSALSIGAIGLSEMAKALEQAGKDQDYKQISEDTPALIARFSEIAENIRPFVETEEPENKVKPPIDAASLRSGLEKVLAAIDELDSHGAVEILDRLSDFCYSPEVSEELSKSRRYTDNFAYEKADETVRHILEIL